MQYQAFDLRGTVGRGGGPINRGSKDFGAVSDGLSNFMLRPEVITTSGRSFSFPSVRRPLSLLPTPSELENGRRKRNAVTATWSAR